MSLFFTTVGDSLTTVFYPVRTTIQIRTGFGKESHAVCELQRAQSLARSCTFVFPKNVKRLITTSTTSQERIQCASFADATCPCRCLVNWSREFVSLWVPISAKFFSQF
jgi:hypothetical protein